MSDEIYREVILDYYRNPRNKGEIEKPDISAEDYNPLCGDKISFQMQINGNGMVDTAKFNGEGCAISQASASMLTEMVEGKNLDEMREMNKDDVLESLGTVLFPAFRFSACGRICGRRVGKTFIIY